MTKLPAAIVAGFLGAGKTTLLNHVLAGAHGRRVAVLVNDFGAINIDAQLISRVEGETISLSNGCICCTIRGDLAGAVARIIAGDQRPDYIIVETSGISDPAAAAMGLVLSAELATSVRLDAIVTVVDCGEVLSLAGTQADLAADQVAAADIVIANKADLVDESTLQQVRSWIRTQAPDSRIVESSHCRVPMELIFGLEREAPARTRAPGQHLDADHTHHGESTHGFRTFAWQHPEPLSFEAVYSLFKSLPLCIFRAKGILSLDSVPERRVLVQMVGRRVVFIKGEPWADAARLSQVVMIGSEVQNEELEAGLEACLARNAPRGNSRMAQAVVELLRR